MSYRIVYSQTPVLCDAEARWQESAWSEEFTSEHQALGRARELLEAGEHYGVALHDHSGNEFSGVRLQFKLGGFSGE